MSETRRQASPRLTQLQPFVLPLLYLVCALYFTWPLVGHATTHLPDDLWTRGTLPLFNLWTLEWNADRILHGYRGYWDAPIFHGIPASFAFSEPQLLTGIAYGALRWVFGSPALAYNAVMWTMLTLNGVAARRLMRRLGAAPGAATVGGLLGVALPFVAVDIAILQLTAVFPMFFALAALIEFSERPAWRPALETGFWSGAAFLTCGFYGLAWSVFLLVGALVLVRREHLALRAVAMGATAAGVAALLVLPVALPQLRGLTDFTRPLPTLAVTSAELGDYGLDLYPGTVLLLLGVGGVIFGKRRRTVYFLVVGAGLAFLLSFGPNLSVFSVQPYALFHDIYPGFSKLRSPERFAAVSQVFLVALAGISLGEIWRRGWRAAAVIVVALALFETASPSQRLHPYPSEALAEPWIGWLAQAEPGPIVMLPFSQSRIARDHRSTVVGMLQALEHGKPLVEGYSGFVPKRVRDLRRVFGGSPASVAIALHRCPVYLKKWYYSWGQVSDGRCNNKAKIS